MGRYYALHSDENPAVAEAIFEHYLPRFDDDLQPKTMPPGDWIGRPVGYADGLVCG